MSKLLFMICMLGLGVLYASSGHAADAPGYLVLQWSQNSRIILSKSPCLVPGLEGGRAVVQRLEQTGKVSFIKGCWTVDPANPDLVKIMWEPNQYSAKAKIKHDFAVLEMAKFTYVEE